MLKRILFITFIFSLIIFNITAYAIDEKGEECIFSIVDFYEETIAESKVFFNYQEDFYLVPLRDFFEAMGAEVIWNSEDGSIIIDFNGEERWSVMPKNGHLVIEAMDMDEKDRLYYYSEYSGGYAKTAYFSPKSVVIDGKTYIMFDSQYGYDISYMYNKQYEMKYKTTPGKSMKVFFQTFRCSIEFDYENRTLKAKKLPKPFYSDVEKYPCKLHIGDQTINVFISLSGDQLTYYPLVETILALGGENVVETEYDCTFECNGIKYICRKELWVYDEYNSYEWDWNRGKFTYSLEMYNGNKYDGHDAFYTVRVSDSRYFYSQAVIVDDVLYISGSGLFEHFGYRVDSTNDGFILVKDDSIVFEETHSGVDNWYAQ